MRKFIVFDIIRMISDNTKNVYIFRIFPILFVVLVSSGCGPSAGEGEVDRYVATNAQLDAVTGDVDAFVGDLTALAARHGGELSRRGGGPGSVTLRVPVERWPEVFAELRALPEAAGGEQVWGQDVTDQIIELERDLATADGEEATALRARLDYRLDRVERAVIVVRFR